MTFTHEWANAEQTCLRRTDEDGNVAWVPTDPRNTDYAAFVASGEEPAPYVAPEPPAPLTTEEKVNNMLSAFDLTREEMQAALAAK